MTGNHFFLQLHKGRVVVQVDEIRVRLQDSLGHLTGTVAFGLRLEIVEVALRLLTLAVQLLLHAVQSGVQQFGRGAHDTAGIIGVNGLKLLELGGLRKLVVYIVELLLLLILALLLLHLGKLLAQLVPLGSHLLHHLLLVVPVVLGIVRLRDRLRLGLLSGLRFLLGLWCCLGCLLQLWQVLRSNVDRTGDLHMLGLHRLRLRLRLQGAPRIGGFKTCSRLVRYVRRLGERTGQTGLGVGHNTSLLFHRLNDCYHAANKLGGTVLLEGHGLGVGVVQRRLGVLSHVLHMTLQLLFQSREQSLLRGLVGTQPDEQVRQFTLLEHTSVL